ncbi:Hypothetical predicted protein [Mytilus galloprovincialis]|uniref:Uncharacterized protein n=1 Tax=Mytilus galloprovincialis TaxID=29158 RepID=A0A8B6F6T9_MYTGA|nr:Hypothetical predicted protein [Mytilus galloprovincialis]
MVNYHCVLSPPDIGTLAYRPAGNPVNKVFNDITTQGFGASFDGKGAQASFTKKPEMILKTSSLGDTLKYDETLEYNIDSDMADSQGSQDGDSVKPDIPTRKPSQRKANSDWKKARGRKIIYIDPDLSTFYTFRGIYIVVTPFMLRKFFQ